MSHTPDNFKSREFLTQHIADTLAFYEPNIDDEHGGFYQNFSDNGEVFDKQTRHLVSSTRFVFNYARAYQTFNDEKYLNRVKSGIEFIRKHHFVEQTGGYNWLLSVEQGNATVLDDTNHCYGFAFVILAYSWAYRVGVTEAREYLNDTFQTMETHFWDAKAGLYKDQHNNDFTKCDPYRGQNANMHTCEALIAAYEATQDELFLNRALTLADNMVNRQANLMGGLIWEHYDINWQVDLEYNKDDPKNLFRPWGFQPGHQTEWSKLLMFLNKHKPQTWLVERAKALFDNSIDVAWDKQHGGICYGFAPDKSICDDDKYFWVQAETLCCAAYLYETTGDEKYQQWYDKIWQYSWQHLVDHQYGAWFRILTVDNKKIDTMKSPIGKTDYHTMGACFDVLALLK
ncbi:AGE family epimerase/isomerase [Pseudoalteromonas sp. Angola-18]|jgi:mannose/cellobiose epimerase-like protein (N-acyl-D-glucosamine 2-epimerase family)|uniref:AGE family epimerase/isomerase n=1 Tax=Pseudoalteromonas sp. Angola-18 TaxID=3025338 RepID=UPI00235A0D61|nr:AGE family epimerase/isomerase [Pseudoalteromonas sp. Angola-18]MDC9502042.1 AGE family epimerase/isomerase [Pseudoalteromonas sp. Angola-18]